MGKTLTVARETQSSPHLIAERPVRKRRPHTHPSRRKPMPQTKRHTIQVTLPLPQRGAKARRAAAHAVQTYIDDSVPFSLSTAVRLV